MHGLGTDIFYPNSDYLHSVYNHGHGDFGYGKDSTSNIEQLWDYLKSIIKNLYYSIPHKYFILFLGEVEFRRNLKI